MSTIDDYPEEELREAWESGLEAWLDEQGTEPGPLFVHLSRAHGRARITPRSLTRLVKRVGRAPPADLLCAVERCTL